MKSVKIKSEPKEPVLPPGYRFITEQDRESVAGMSGWLPIYPELLRKAIRWDEDFGWSAPGFRYLWEDQIYAVPEAVGARDKVEGKCFEKMDE